MRVVLVPFVVTLVGCVAPAPESLRPPDASEPWVSVAAISGIDFIGFEHVSNLLRSHGIECGGGGSAFWAIDVPGADAERARELLRDDPVHRAWVTGSALPTTALSPRFEVPIGRAYIDAVDAVDLKPEWRAVLAEKHGRDAARSCPRVVKIEANEDRYMDETGEWRTGFDVVLTMSAEPPETGRWRLTFQVWDGGRKVQLKGGNGTAVANQRELADDAR